MVNFEQWIKNSSDTKSGLYTINARTEQNSSDGQNNENKVFF